MALILKDRVKESSSSSGTGNITLGGAFPGYQTFNAAVATGSTVYYTIHNLSAGFDTEWEVGVGTFTSPATLARNTVLSSSTGSLINFTAGTEGLEVFITQPAEEAVYLNQATGLVEVGGNGTNTVAFTNINASNVVMVSGTISTNAANATDITNKTYVDGLFSQSISYHEAVLVESPVTTGNLDAIYVQPNGAGNGVGATLTNNAANVALVVDGVSVSNTARVLIYSQSNAVQNGVYTVTNPGAPDSPGPGAKWVLTRATDADTFGLANPNALGAGDAFYVQSGNTGAGETYVCNTQGTITFGSSNITFAQISSAQIYAAGTGLNLSNLTFSIANTAVTAATYGNDGAVGQFTVNAQGQITNAATVSVNASAISVGTLANARTTADSANGASTIVLRDINGSFNANVGTFTTVNATTGNFTNITGNAVSLTDINASNITSGTISNARTTGSTSNSASTLVLRDSNGAFEAGNVTAANFIGAGTTITSINASNISSGTIDNSRTTAASANGASTIVLRDAGGNFSANTITANVAGDISGGTNINASNITSGTISNARTTASSANGASTIVLRDVNGSFDANVVNATNLSGGGTSITSMNASNLSAGTVASARVSGSYTGITGVGTVTAGTWQGNVIATTYGGTNLSSFTANGVVYASSTSALATGSGFVFDGTNVLIGNSTDPLGGNRLLVQSAATANFNRTFSVFNTAATSTTPFANRLVQISSYGTGADATLHFSDQALYNAYIGMGSGALYFATNGTTERMRIDSSGNVGIGTTAPESRLDVLRQGNTAGGTMMLSGSKTNNGIKYGYMTGAHYTNTTYPQGVGIIGCTSSSGENNISIGGDLGEVIAATAIRFFTAANATTAAGTERMRIDSSGNVVIGANAAIFSARFGVKSSSNALAAFVDSTAAGAAYYINTNGSGQINHYATWSNSGVNAYHAWWVTASGGSQTQAMTLDVNGNLGIGKTPTDKTLELYTATNTALRIQNSSTGTTGSDGLLLEMNGLNINFYNYENGNIQFGTNSAERMRLTAAGGLAVGTTSDPGAGAIYATGNITAFFSDERLKTKTGDIENALDKVCQIETLLYHANETAVELGYDASIQEVGVTAQSVQKVQPEVVVPAPVDDKYLTVRYEKLVPLLIEAIKELKAEVDALKGK